MKVLYKKLFFLVFSIVLILSCSKEESPVESVKQSGGIVFRSQVVTINLSDVTLSENEYQGMLAGIEIKLMKSEDNKLMFLVPYSATIGFHDLVIPALGDATVHYEVKDTVLSDTTEVTMAPFIANLNTFSQTLDTSPEAAAVQNSLDSFNAVFDNASIEDKTKMAILYKSNKALFDDIILNDFSNVPGRNVDPTDLELLAKHSMAVYVMAAGAIIAIVAPEPIEKTLGVALVAVGAYKAREYFIQVLTKKLNTITCAVNGIFGTANRNTADTFVAFQSDVTNTVSLNAVERGIITGDAASTQSAAVSFFKDYNKYNYYINKVNDIITWVNANVLFANFNLIMLEQLASASPQVSTSADTEIFSHFTFSLNHANLSLVSNSLQSNGQMNIKIKIIGTPSSLPVESFLNYSYTDEFSSFSGKVPIRVGNINVISLVGSWALAGVYEGYVTNIGAVYATSSSYSNSCGYGSSSITYSQNISFTESSFSMNYTKINSSVGTCDIFYGNYLSCERTDIYDYTFNFSTPPTFVLNEARRINGTEVYQTTENCVSNTTPPNSNYSSTNTGSKSIDVKCLDENTILVNAGYSNTVKYIRQ